MVERKGHGRRRLIWMQQSAEKMETKNGVNVVAVATVSSLRKTVGFESAPASTFSVRDSIKRKVFEFLFRLKQTNACRERKKTKKSKVRLFVFGNNVGGASKTHMNRLRDSDQERRRECERRQWKSRGERDAVLPILAARRHPRRRRKSRNDNSSPATIVVSAVATPQGISACGDDEEDDITLYS